MRDDCLTCRRKNEKGLPDTHSAILSWEDIFVGRQDSPAFWLSYPRRRRLIRPFAITGFFPSHGDRLPFKFRMGEQNGNHTQRDNRKQHDP
jgi:hypothetical protein